MKTFAKYFVPALLLTVLVVMPVTAQTAKSESGYKIGVVDMDRLRDDHDWLKGKYADLETLRTKLEGEIKHLLDEIEVLATKIQEGRGTLSQSELLRLDGERQAKTTEYQNEFKIRQLQIDESEFEVNKEAYADIQKVIAAFAKEANYHLILKAQNNPGSQVLFFNANIDITSEVLARLNKLKK